MEARSVQRNKTSRWRDFNKNFNKTTLKKKGTNLRKSEQIQEEWNNTLRKGTKLLKIGANCGRL